MKSRYISVKHIRGLSLVELMVAITIGLIILAAVSSLFVNTKQTYNSQDSLARLQENARFAMHFLIKDIRLSGYFGCLDGVDPGSPLTVNPDTTVQSSNTKFNLQGGLNFATSPFLRLQGIENATGSTTWFPSGAAQPANISPGTDALSIHMVDGSNAANIAPGMLNGASPLIVDDATPFTVNNVVVVSDCASADVIQITGITGNTLQHDTSGGTINNVSLSLSKAYDPPSRVSTLSSRQYFVRVKANGVPALFRQDVGAAQPQELVEGIEDLQILYGEDTDAPADGLPNIYRTAAAVVDWTKVMSVRVGILARAVSDKSGDIDNGSYDVDGDGTNELSTPGDRFRRRVFQAVVKLRNI